MNTSDTLDLNVALLPDAHIGDTAISLSQKIAGKYSVHFTLDSVNHIPHLSLYHARYPNKNSTEVVNQIERVAKLASPFPVILDRVACLENFIFLAARGSGGLSLLQSMVLDALNPLREGLILPDYRTILDNKSADLQQVEYIRHYGYAYVKEAFSPHVTLTRLKEKREITKAMALVPNEIRTFQSSELVIGTIGPHGTLTKIEKVCTL